MRDITIVPYSSDLWHIEGGDFSGVMRRASRMDFLKAAEVRFDAAQAILEAVGDDEVLLDWSDANTRAALEVLYASGADHLGIGETDMAVALWEMLLAMDEEDHLSVSIPLAIAYIEIEDYDCLEEVLFNISSKSPEYYLVQLWAEYRRTGGVDRDSLRMLRTRHKAWFEEILASEHPSDEAFWEDSRRERPSPATEARELWFATETVWERNRDFLETISKA